LCIASEPIDEVTLGNPNCILSQSLPFKPAPKGIGASKTLYSLKVIQHRPFFLLPKNFLYHYAVDKLSQKHRHHKYEVQLPEVVSGLISKWISVSEPFANWVRVRNFRYLQNVVFLKSSLIFLNLFSQKRNVKQNIRIDFKFLLQQLKLKFRNNQ
jgi:hypothetical protein